MAKYPPTGKRSITGLAPQMGYRAVPITEAISIGNADHSTVFVMIESPEAVENIDGIAATEGVSVVLIGTNDLSIELGVPGEWDNPIFTTALAKISTAVKKHGKVLGIAGIYNRPDIMHKCIHEYGARYVLSHGDQGLFVAAAAANVAGTRELENRDIF